MSTKTFCDGCGKEESKSLPVIDYQVCAKVECFDTAKAERMIGESHAFAIEFERFDLCQDCVTKCGDMAKIFVATIMNRIQDAPTPSAKGGE